MAGLRSIFRASAVSAVGTGLSRVLGAARDVAISHVFGAGRASDAFWVAWTVPSVFRRFVADEGLTGALIPAVAQSESQESEREARRLAGSALLALLGAGVAIVVAGILAAPWLVRVFAYGFADDPDQLALTVTLTRWLFPFVLFVSLVSYCEALLNHRGHFFVPKIAPGIVSAFVAASALLFATRLAQPVMALAIGVLIGGVAHLLACVPPLVKLWGLPRPRADAFKTRRFRLFLREMGKVVLIGLVAQLNLVLLRLLATLLEDGAVTQYWYANRVVDLAQGAIAVGVGSALLPLIARDAANRDWERFRDHFYQGVVLASLVLIPAAALLIGMAEPVVSILFRHGAFDASAAAHTAGTLKLLVPFMLALAGINIVKKVFFSLDDRTTLLVVGSGGLLVTAGLGYALSSRLGVEGLGAALSLSVSLQFAVYLAVLKVKAGTRIALAALAGPIAKLALAAAPAGLAAHAITRYGVWIEGPARLENWLLLAAGGATGAAVYAALGLALGVRELRDLLARVARRPRR